MSTEPQNALQRILVVGPSWVGDMVMAQSLFMRLREQHPEARIDVLAPGWSLPLLERMPEVSGGIELGCGHGELKLLHRRALGRELRRESYQWCIVLPRSLKAALVPAFAKIPRRTGFRGEYRYGLLNDIRPFDRQRLNQTVKRFAALAVESGADGDDLERLPQPKLRVDRHNAQALQAQFGISADRKCIAFAPGAEYGPAKRWPAEHFAALATRCVEAGMQVLILGSAKEAPIGAAIQSASDADAVFNLCGQTQLVDVVDLLGASSVAVCNDSGLMHVAAATGVPLVAIYGSSSPGFTPPLSEAAKVLYRNLSCSPCFKRECPLGHLDCLKGIGADEAFDAMHSVAAL